ncbi:MAG: thymidine phosphorylase [Saprospiraceae bacterium]|nr:thymidine phosphorylase [Saprospiraceae bacterium]
MNIKELITKKRDRKALSSQEIGQLVKLVCDPEVPDYQISALLMAIFLNGMDDMEIASLTKNMAYSGEVLDFSNEPGPILDKHSTGGVGDKTSLILVPLLNELGLKIAKLSGKGLGHTGGTLDKLSVFDGFRIDLSKNEIQRQVGKIGMAITGQTEFLVPADKRIYTLRDLTCTIESIPLIASSIMSKKIACGAGHILLDVKVGSGAMFSDLEHASMLARQMVSIGTALNVPTRAVLTDMSVPLGSCIGNALEVKEAIEILKGEGDLRLRTLCFELAARAFQMVNENIEYQEIDYQINRAINSGNALNKLKVLVEAQGGNSEYIYHPERLPLALHQSSVAAPNSGYISRLDARKIGMVSMLSGAGRVKKEDILDLGAGVILEANFGQYVRTGDPLASIFASSQSKLAEAADVLQSAFEISQQAPGDLPLILKEY